MDKKILQEHALMKEVVVRLGWSEVNKLRTLARQETDNEQKEKITTQSERLILFLGELTRP
jgi:Asp-tRNA(Asn)/Glu-tRNA(Gln) amidotransferase C subunit